MPPPLSNHSLTVSLSSEVGSGTESDGSPIITILRFLALVDSGSSHCFVDSKYVEDHNLLPNLFLLDQLPLLDGSADLIFPIHHPSSLFPFWKHYPYRLLRHSSRFIM